MTGAWRAMPVAVVRPAGFPLDLLDPLADARLPQLVDAVRESRAQLDRAAQDFEAVSRKAHRPQDADGVRAARAAYRAVQRRKPLPGVLWFEDPVGGHTDAQAFAHWWTSTCTARDTALDELAGRYTAALGTAREHLGSVLRDPRVREALVLLTPEILDTTVAALLKRPPGGPAPNQNERKAVSFLQRLAAKCETNAFAGPIAYATLGAPADWTGPPAARQGFLAFWAVKELLDQALERHAPHTLDWRPGPAAGMLPEQSPVRRAVTRAAAGRAGEVPAATLRTLHRRNLLWASELLAPTSEPDALALLRTAAEHLGDDTLRTLAQELTRTAALFAEADAEGKSAAVSRADAVLTEQGLDVARRGKGQLYADRVVLYEEDHAPEFSVRFDEEAVRNLLTRLDPVLDLAAAAGAEAWLRARDAFTAAWHERYGPAVTELRLPEVLASLPVSAPVPLDGTDVARRLHDLVAATWDGTSTEVVLDPSAVRAILPEPDGAPGPMILAPDLHFDTCDRSAVESGRAPVVVGEFHWGLQGLGNLCCFIEDRDALARATRDWLHDPAPQAPELVHVATHNRFGKLCYLELLPRTVELSGPAAPGQDRLRAEDLVVRPDATVTDRHTGRRVMPLLGDAEAATQSPLGPPSCGLPRIVLGPLTPRISIGDVVVQRAAWRLDAQVFQPPQGAVGAERYRHTVDALRALGVPRRVYAAVQGERKPVHVDLASPHLVELLVAESRERPVRLTEMLPAPDRTWQRSDLGRHVCEIRFSVRRRTSPRTNLTSGVKN
ncbi:hypothetical protein ACWGF3_08995 [Streptomyces xanthophaeus]|uniref:hypothetical protein n=1 Tax=Streptomyces xanthophaeus TaxID=67385 RepID=UPI00068F7ADE|nr:hypothetical protein [Streptomyces xanthophaeus]